MAWEKKQRWDLFAHYSRGSTLLATNVTLREAERTIREHHMDDNAVVEYGIRPYAGD